MTASESHAKSMNNEKRIMNNEKYYKNHGHSTGGGGFSPEQFNKK